MVISTMPLIAVLLMATMDRIGSIAACSSELAHGFMARRAFTVMLTIAMILITVTLDRFQSVGNSRSITFMRTRRATGEATSATLAMMLAMNTAPERRGAMVAANTPLEHNSKRELHRCLSDVGQLEN